MRYAWICVAVLCKVQTAVLEARRSVHRPPDPYLPRLEVSWQQATPEQVAPGQVKPKVHRISHSHIHYKGVFGHYNPEHLHEYALPTGPIASYNGQQIIGYGDDIQRVLQETIQEIQESIRPKREYTHARILKQSNYNPTTRSGLIVVRLKNYPLVAKIFLETPKTFVRPFSKGIEPCCFFIMGKGMSRYLAGFTRIENAERVREKIKADAYWRDRVLVPRKWFWQPPDVRLFDVRGYNTRGKGTFDQASFPSVYVIIADAFDAPACRLSRRIQRRDALDLCRFLGSSVDPHINNFLYEGCTGQMMLIDTEHFSVLVGIDDKVVFKSYAHYYAALCKKCFLDLFFTQRQRA